MVEVFKRTDKGGEIKARARTDFNWTMARAGITRMQLAEAAGVSTRTVDALANPASAGRQGTTRVLTAWKVARGFAALAGLTEDAAFEALFEAQERPAA